jgi:Ulp1 protease family, C-terminal catalytic domain
VVASYYSSKSTTIIQYHDPLHYGEHPFLEALFRYMQEEHQRHPHGAFPFPELADPYVASLHQQWKILPCTDKSTPRQPNGYDCGIYVCAIVDCIRGVCPYSSNRTNLRVTGTQLPWLSSQGMPQRGPPLSLMEARSQHGSLPSSTLETPRRGALLLFRGTLTAPNLVPTIVSTDLIVVA